MVDLIQESQDEDLQLELKTNLKSADKELSKFELSRMFHGKHDAPNAIIEINSGAGGTEAQDWGEMLLRMYLRWAENKEFKATILDINSGDKAGIKSATILLESDNAFGHLRSERGVHLSLIHI